MRRSIAALAAASALGLALVAARKRKRFSWENARVLIMGGTRGLGLELAREALRRGASVAVCGRDPSTRERAGAELARLGRVLVFECDVRDEKSVAKAVAAVQDAWGGIDVVVHNAGTIAVGPFETLTGADYEDALRTHFWGAFALVEHALPALRQSDRARIVLVSSIGGKVAIPHLLAYSVSKFALTAFGEGLRAEVARLGIGVTVACPGLMRTGSPRNAFFKGRNVAEYAWFSVADSLPGLSMPACRAARQILDAAERNRAEVVLSIPARALAGVHAVFPGLTAGAMRIVVRLLPQRGGIGTARTTGAKSESAVTRSPLTALTRHAEGDLNQR